MSRKKEITKEQIAKFFKKNFYVSTELLTYYTLIAINLMKDGKVRVGQDIYTTTLDGPPGAGKSMYAKLYAKMVHELLRKDTVLISYQCDKSTGKIELFEDINVGAAVAAEPEKVNIPGILTKAINMVNEGKKVILFIDEYDKTREETDSLFLQMLQDGIINTNQFGDMIIEDKYKGNLQVIFCKNDTRTELTGPLTRRTRMVYLDIMKPIDFRALAMRRLYNETNDKEEITIIELVSLLYEEIYKHRDGYKRVCAASELFGAIQDLTYLSRIEAPNDILYETLICDLFKSKDDRDLFETNIPSIENPALKNTLQTLSKKEDQEEDLSITDIIAEELKELAKIEAEKVLQEERDALAKKQQELAAKEKELESKKQELERKKQEAEQERQKIEKYLQEVENKFNALLAKKQAESPNTYSFINDFALNFDDITNHIRRGHHIFETMENRTEVASLSIPLKELTNEKLVTMFLNKGAIVYENGFFITNPYNIIVVRTYENIDGKVTFSFYMDKEFLDEDTKKIKMSSYSEYTNIKSTINNICELILTLNESELHEIDFKPLDEVYGVSLESSSLSHESEIFERVLKKTELDELPF